MYIPSKHVCTALMMYISGKQLCIVLMMYIPGKQLCTVLMMYIPGKQLCTVLMMYIPGKQLCTVLMMYIPGKQVYCCCFHCTAQAYTGYSLAGGPVLPQGLPQLDFFGRQAVQQQLLCILGKHGGGCLLPEVHAAVDGVAAGLVDEAEWCEQEVDQLGGIGVMNVSLQLGLSWTSKSMLLSAQVRKYLGVLRSVNHYIISGQYTFCHYTINIVKHVCAKTDRELKSE